MSQRLSRIVFTAPVQDPSAAGQFERRDFNKVNARALVIEREPDGTITLTAPDGAQVIASGIPYWCNPMRGVPVTMPIKVLAGSPATLPPTTPPVPPAPKPKPKADAPPVTQTQLHPRDRMFRGKRP
jgi:hypothetical protein